jgi:hypothetical protein
MGWWNNDASKKDAQKKRGFNSRENCEYVEAYIVERRGPKSELRDPRPRRYDARKNVAYR